MVGKFLYGVCIPNFRREFKNLKFDGTNLDEHVFKMSGLRSRLKEVKEDVSDVEFDISGDIFPVALDLGCLHVTWL